VLSKQQKEYLAVMGVSVWSLREPPAVETESTEETAFGESAEFTLDAPDTPAVDIATEMLPEIPVEEPVVTVPEPPADTRTAIPGLKLGPGGGGILLVCARDSDSASRLANDISRALGSVPVWAWPDTGSGAVQLADAVQENLFTTVAIFGDELAQRFFAADIPSSVHAANLVQLPAMQEIGTQAEARRTLWAALCRSGMVSRS
jgi:DNA polymerase III psi subunit